VRGKPIVLIAVLALAGTIGLVIAVNSGHGALTLPHLGPECTVRADGEVTLDSVQMANAATITAVGVRRKMPEQAVVIALATALQESKLENRDHGDRDSLGLFQQRPSQGWGTAEKIRDPRYASDRFYTALKKVKGWKKMRVTEAAQKVQRSAYPNAYEKWADESAVLARALTGKATGAVECRVPGDPVLRAGQAGVRAGRRADRRRRRPERRLALCALARLARQQHRSRTGTFRRPRVEGGGRQVAARDRRPGRQRTQGHR